MDGPPLGDDGFNMGGQAFGDPNTMMSEQIKHQMIFNIIQNRKGEKILSIQGFNPNEQEDRLQEYGEEYESKEGDEDDQVLFINLNKLAANRNNVNVGDSVMPENIHTGQASLNKLGQDNVHEYLTENPYTKVLDQFPNRLAKEEIPNVIVSDEIGSGSHARVYRGEFLDTPVAIKVYKNQNPLSLNAFISELEAYYLKAS